MHAVLTADRATSTGCCGGVGTVPDVTSALSATMTTSTTYVIGFCVSIHPGPMGMESYLKIIIIDVCLFQHSIVSLCLFQHTVLSLCLFQHAVLLLCLFQHTVLPLCLFQHNVLSLCLFQASCPIIDVKLVQTSVP